MPDQQTSDRVPPDPAGGEVARAVWERLEPRLAEMVDALGELVQVESGSNDPDGLDRLAKLLGARFAHLGRVDRHPIGPGGASHLILEVSGRHSGELPHTVVLAHYDTVWNRGTIERLPFEVRDGRLAGPGCFDMKGGIVLLEFALRELAALGVPPRRDVRVLFSCDEEVRSRTSRGLIGRLAEGAGVALVLEAPLPGGALKTARKGTATYTVVVEGRAAHAGVEPEKGINAVVELAHQTGVLHALNDAQLGTSVNVGVVRGGTRSNVVPARAEADVDVRVATVTEAERVDQAIRSLRPVLPGAVVSAEADLTRPPMERTDATARLFAHARAIADVAGLPDLAEGATGGASDGNLVAARGVPTLDGLGPEGGGAHADDEHVVVDSLPRRAALLAGLLAGV